MPDIAFRFYTLFKYSFNPEDYMTTPAINQTTNNPYCKLGVVNYWNDNIGSVNNGETLTLSTNAGFGSVWLINYGFYQAINPERT